MVAAAPNGPRGRGHRGDFPGNPRRAITRESEPLDDDFREARAEVVGSAEFEREENRARRTAIGGSSTQRPIGRRIDHAATAVERALGGQRLVADPAPRIRRQRKRAPARLADSAAKNPFDRAGVAREASRRQKVGRRGPADSLERRRGRDDASFRRADSRPRDPPDDILSRPGGGRLRTSCRVEARRNGRCSCRSGRALELRYCSWEFSRSPPSPKTGRSAPHSAWSTTSSGASGWTTSIRATETCGWISSSKTASSFAARSARWRSTATTRV